MRQSMYKESSDLEQRGRMIENGFRDGRAPISSNKSQTQVILAQPTRLAPPRKRNGQVPSDGLPVSALQLLLRRRLRASSAIFGFASSNV
ncbi:uncharacterized protein VTP21DRAFT_947 [Calcarisporiella thermophila]|uniref:uncharacterized protein n=1 Tax=Calcarisporiella thermophila TaxID=911321 RepID=UPI00374263FD